MSIKIDPEFKSLIPPLSPDEFQMLEENCKNYRIRDALVVGVFPGSDGTVLIDGHNRYEIAKKNNLAYEVKRIDFESREDAIDWIIRNQLGRRNIPKYVRGELILRLKPVIAEKAKENLHQGQEPLQKSVNPVNTQKELAKLAGVSHDTIHKVEKIQAEASEDTKQKLRKGDISINQAFNRLPSQQNRNIVKEATRQAQKEHLEYLEEKANGVINIDSAKKEKENAGLLVHETEKWIRKLIEAASNVRLMVSDEDIRYLGTHLSKFERRDMQDKLRNVFSTVIKLQKNLEVEHGKGNI